MQGTISLVRQYSERVRTSGRFVCVRACIREREKKKPNNLPVIKTKKERQQTWHPTSVCTETSTLQQAGRKRGDQKQDITEFLCTTTRLNACARALTHEHAHVDERAPDVFVDRGKAGRERWRGGVEGVHGGGRWGDVGSLCRRSNAAAEEREARVTGRTGRPSGNNTVSLNQHFQEKTVGAAKLWQAALSYATGGGQRGGGRQKN